MTGDATSTHVHRWMPVEGAARTLLLLHGTGGDENDLLPLARALDPRDNVLSPRGNVLEGALDASAAASASSASRPAGAPRFFRRLAPGVFDVDDLRRRTHELADFVAAAAARYHFDLQAVCAVGFSNGANIGASLLLERPEVLAEAVLIRAMMPFKPASLPSLAGKRVLLLAGERDPYSTREGTEALAAILRSGGAEVAASYAKAGHELTGDDVEKARAWMGREK